MKSISKYAAAFSLTLACGAVLAEPANLVTNGSFEFGLSNWTIGGTSDGFLPVDISYGLAAAYPRGAFGEVIPQNNALTNSPDQIGSKALYFVSDFALNQSLTQTISVTTKGLYEIGFSAYAPGNGFNNLGDAAFSGVIASVVLASYNVSSGLRRTWETFSGITELDVGNHTVQFLYNTNLFPSKDIVIDQVYVTKVPEPGSLALLGLGLAGLAAVARRKSKQA